VHFAGACCVRRGLLAANARDKRSEPASVVPGHFFHGAGLPVGDDRPRQGIRQAGMRPMSIRLRHFAPPAPPREGGVVATEAGSLVLWTTAAPIDSPGGQAKPD